MKKFKIGKDTKELKQELINAGCVQDKKDKNLFKTPIFNRKFIFKDSNMIVTGRTFYYTLSEISDTFIKFVIHFKSITDYRVIKNFLGVVEQNEFNYCDDFQDFFDTFGR